VLFALVAGLLLCEGLVALFHPQLFARPDLWQFDRQLGWSHLPGGGGRLVKPEFDVGYEINAAGLREREIERRKPAGTRRLLVFGDSFAEGWGVEVEHTIGRRLEDLLNAGTSPVRHEVLNFGVAGYGTDQELLLFDLLGRHYDPDALLVFFYVNDLINNQSPRGIGAERGFKPQFTITPSGDLELRGVPVRESAFWQGSGRSTGPWPHRLRRYLVSSWHLAALVNKSLAPPLPQGQRQLYYEALYGTAPDSRTRRMWELSGRVLEEFAARAAAAAVDLHLIYVPAIVQVEEANWRTKRKLHGLVGDFDLDKPNREIARLAEGYGLDLLDLTPAFRQSQVRLYYDESHWNPAGHQLAAELVAAHLKGDGGRDAAGL